MGRLLFLSFALGGMQAVRFEVRQGAVSRLFIIQPGSCKFRSILAPHWLSTCEYSSESVGAFLKPAACENLVAPIMAVLNRSPVYLRNVSLVSFRVFEALL